MPDHQVAKLAADVIALAENLYETVVAVSDPFTQLFFMLYSNPVVILDTKL